MKDSDEQRASENGFIVLAILFAGFLCCMALLGSHAEDVKARCENRGGTLVQFQRTTECMKDGLPIKVYP